MELQAIYSSLQAESPAAQTIGDLRIRKVFPEECLDLFAGIRVATNQKVLLLSCDSDSLPKKQLPRCKGFETRIATYTESAKETHWLELRQKATNSTTPFDAMVNEVSDTVLKASPHAKQAVFLETIKRWRDCFSPSESGYLNRQEQAGLYAELCFLSDVLLVELADAILAVKSWRGPARESKDFQLPTCSIESKACCSPKQEKIIIAFPSQLHAPPEHALYIYYVSMEETRQGGEPLSKRVAQIRAKLKNSNALHIFNGLLNKSRYRDVHQLKYDKRSYIRRAFTYFQVTDGFPRIQKQDIGNGISDVVYSIQVGALSQFRVPEKQVLEHIAAAHSERQRKK